MHNDQCPVAGPSEVWYCLRHLSCLLSFVQDVLNECMGLTGGTKWWYKCIYRLITGFGWITSCGYDLRFGFGMDKDARTPLNSIVDREIDRNRSTPLYIQVHERLMELLTHYSEAGDHYLPSERELTKAFGVDRLTVRRALDVLHRDGLIRKRAGARTVITKIPERIGETDLARSIPLVLPRGVNSIDRITEPFNASLFHEAERCITESGYHLVYMTFSDDDSAERILERGNFSGFIFVSEVPKSLIHAVYKRSIPAVVVNGLDDEFPCVIGDREAGVIEAVSYLIELGHQDIGFIGGTPGYLNSSLSLSGFSKALRAHGLDVNESLITTGYWTFDGGYEAMQEFLAMTSVRPTAVFAANDSMVFGAQEAIRNAGLRVPEDISIVGFDNIEQSVCASPQITTVSLTVSAVVRAAWRILKDQIEGREIINAKTVLPVELVIRQSAAPPRHK